MDNDNNTPAPGREAFAINRDGGVEAKKFEDGSLPPLQAWIDNARENRLFSELHTHLTGMGSYEFWIDEVMENVIPDLVKKKELEWYENKGQLSFSTAINAAFMPNFGCDGILSIKFIGENLLHLCEEKLKGKLQAGNMNFRFTYDVVYGLENYLFKAFNVTTPDEVANITGLDVHEFTGKPYIVWNARKQQFEERTGITNTRLMALLKEKRGKGSDLEKSLKNCFTMLGTEGDLANDQAIKKLYQNKFSPEFFPMRYAMKDAMYEQYLEVLDVLIEHIIMKMFNPSGVGYVEFSVGHGDMTRPWVFKRLYKAAAKFQRIGIDIRYLVGFQRNDKNSPSLAAELGKGKGLPELLKMCNDKSYFTEHLSMLQKIRSLTEDEQAAKIYFQFVVGFDYLSDEKDRPFCPFALEEFTDFVKDCRIKHNSRFGLRYHCGELHFDKAKVNEHSHHMAISGHTITKILEAFPPSFPEASPLRIGHGVGFLFFEQRFGVEQKEMLSPIDKEVLGAVAMMGQRNVAVEVNLLSNGMLVVGHLNDELTVKRLMDMHIPVVICTDNDGIWIVDVTYNGKRYCSIAGEFARAIKSGVIRDVDMAEEILNYGIDCRFDDVDRRTLSNPELFKRMIKREADIVADVSHIKSKGSESAKGEAREKTVAYDVVKSEMLAASLEKAVAEPIASAWTDGNLSLLVQKHVGETFYKWQNGKSCAINVFSLFLWALNMDKVVELGRALQGADIATACKALNLYPALACSFKFDAEK